MMQFFEWYLPENQLHWKRTAAQAEELGRIGINMVWLPPAYNGAAGAASVAENNAEDGAVAAEGVEGGGVGDVGEEGAGYAEVGDAAVADVGTAPPGGEAVRCAG